jgi:hypothetical protein
MTDTATTEPKLGMRSLPPDEASPPTRYPPASPSTVTSPPEHHHRLALHRWIAEPATPAERHPLHSHAQQSLAADL